MNTSVNEADFRVDTGEKELEICWKPLTFEFQLLLFFYNFSDIILFLFCFCFVFFFFFGLFVFCFYCMLAMPTCKAKGVQTDMADSTRLTVDNDLSAHDHLSNKLLTIWGSQSGQISGKNLVSKLLVACETDFHVLFGCLSMNMASKMINSLADEDSSDLPSKGHIMSTPSEVVKVSHLYSVLTKVIK